MKLRTEVENRPSDNPLQLSDTFVSLGSCFSTAIGSRLKDGGLEIKVNPMGVLFNPLSIARVVERALNGEYYTDADLFPDNSGIYHLLAFESRRQSRDASRLLESVNRDFKDFSKAFQKCSCCIVTFGTAWIFRHLPTRSIVGNCHKLPDSQFERSLISVDDIVQVWRPLIKRLPRVIFTVSPVRHLNDGLHGNTLSKARLHLAVEMLCTTEANAEYFPAYEALNDDLRDYRFYADDLKHPSGMAEQYIFDLFAERYFTRSEREAMESNRKNLLRAQHRPIIV